MGESPMNTRFEAKFMVKFKVVDTFIHAIGGFNLNCQRAIVLVILNKSMIYTRGE